MGYHRDWNEHGEQVVIEGISTRRHMRALTIETITVDDVLDLMADANHAPNIIARMREHEVAAMVPEGREREAVRQIMADRPIAKGMEEKVESFRALIREAAIDEARRYEG